MSSHNSHTVNVCALCYLMVTTIIRSHEISDTCPVCSIGPVVHHLVFLYFMNHGGKLRKVLHTQSSNIHIREVIITLKGRVIQICCRVIACLTCPVGNLVNITYELHKSEIPRRIVINLLNVVFNVVRGVTCLRKCGNNYPVSLSFLNIYKRCNAVNPIVRYNEKVIYWQGQSRFARLKNTIVYNTFLKLLFKCHGIMVEYSFSGFRKISTYKIYPHI